MNKYSGLNGIQTHGLCGTSVTELLTKANWELATLRVPNRFLEPGIWLISRLGFEILKEKEDEIRDCNFDRDTGSDNFNRRESGNDALKKPRFRNSRD